MVTILTFKSKCLFTEKFSLWNYREIKFHIRFLYICVYCWFTDKCLLLEYVIITWVQNVSVYNYHYHSAQLGQAQIQQINWHFSLFIKRSNEWIFLKKAHLSEGLRLNIDSQNNDNEYVSSFCNSHQSHQCWSRWQLCIDDIYQAALMKWWPGLCITAIIFITWSCYIYVSMFYGIFAGNMWILTCMQNDTVQIQNISWQC